MDPDDPVPRTFRGRLAGEHYVELAKDFSNVDEVLRQTEDLERWRRWRLGRTII